MIVARFLLAIAFIALMLFLLQTAMEKGLAIAGQATQLSAGFAHNQSCFRHSVLRLAGSFATYKTGDSCGG